MKTSDLDPQLCRRGTSKTFMVIAALLTLWGCSDSPLEPRLDTRGVVVTITSTWVAAGDRVSLTFEPTRPCWEEDAEMEVQLSWDATRFAWVDTPGVEIEAAGEGRVRAQGVDRDGFANGMELAFQARDEGSTDGFLVDRLTLWCERGTMVEMYDPPLLVVPNP